MDQSDCEGADCDRPEGWWETWGRHGGSVNPWDSVRVTQGSTHNSLNPSVKGWGWLPWWYGVDDLSAFGYEDFEGEVEARLFCSFPVDASCIVCVRTTR